jgi:LmbE family N-acetylglucosaminyl deacetylase
VRALFLAAHPDDETLGASLLLGRLSDAIVVYLTDGAPRDPQFRQPYAHESRETYARRRSEEAAAALSWAGIGREQLIFLSAVDQESIYQAGTLLESFIDVLERLRPDIIVTHAYEGGHPDHDTAALIARSAVDKIVGQKLHCPVILEFTSYHAVDGQRVSGEFLPPSIGQDVPEITLRFSAEDRARKARMLGCYTSQWHVISEFPLEPERLRVAPEYDFTQPPHPGTLWYECLHWAMTGERWRELAGRVLVREGTAACR